MWFHWQRETHFTHHAWCSWSLPSSLHSLLLLKRPTHMHALTVARILALTVLSWSVLLLCRQTNRLSSSGAPFHQTKADQPSPAGCCSLCLLVWTGSETGCATSGSDPAPELPCLHRQSPKRLMSTQSARRFRRCRGPANGTSGHILTGPVTPLLNKTALISFSLLIFPPPVKLLQDAMPYLVSMCFGMIIPTSIHSFPCVLFRDFNRLELWLTLIQLQTVTAEPVWVCVSRLE